MSNPVKQFWDRVKAKREFMSISQRDMALRLGMTQPAYLYHESAKSKGVPQELAEKVALILDTEVSHLMGIAELSLEQYNDNVKIWISSPEAYGFVMEAYERYQKLNRKVYGG